MHRDHSGGVVWTSFSPKGTYLGTAAMDSTAIVYVYLALLSGGCCVLSWAPYCILCKIVSHRKLKLSTSAPYLHCPHPLFNRARRAAT